MVRHARAAQYEDIARPIIAIGNDYPAGHLHPAHRHRRSQLLHSISGTMVVNTDHGAWVVPPRHGIWIPAGVAHSIRMVGNVTTRSVYVAPRAAAVLQHSCQVVSITPLLAQLLIEAVDLPVEYAPGSRADKLMLLLLQEVQDAPVVALCVPCPAGGRLGEHCQAFLANPALRDGIDQWCTSLGMSRRAFTRQFRRETGISFAGWQRQVRLVLAIPRLAAGDAITAIALDLGYASPAAFTSMFRRVLGTAPSRYQSLQRVGPAATLAR